MVFLVPSTARMDQEYKHQRADAPRSKHKDKPIRISTRTLPNRPVARPPHSSHAPPTPRPHTPIDGTVVRRDARASRGSPRLRSIVPFYLIPRLQETPLAYSLSAFFMTSTRAESAPPCGGLIKRWGVE